MRAFSIACGIGVLYVATAWLGLQLDAVSGFATLVWPPTGIALAGLVVFGMRMWPAITIGALVVNLLAGAPLLPAIGIALGNTLEAVAATALLRWIGFEPALRRLRDVVALVAGVAAGSTLISATIGTFSLWAGGMIGPAGFGATWSAWWIGDALGDLIVAPFLLVWTRLPAQRRIWEALAMVVVLALTALFVFDVILPRERSDDVRTPYLVFPVLMWAALRFRQHGGTGGVLVVWLVAIVATALGLGPFASTSLTASLLPLQLFMAVVALTTLALAAAVCERDSALTARDDFLAVASHELRTPLAALGLQIANLRAVPGIPERKLSMLQRQAERLGALVDNLLDVSRITAGRFELESERVDLAEVVRTTTARLADHAHRAGCSLDVETVEVSATTDRLRFEQILVNLVSNAIKHGAGKPIAVRLAATDANVTLVVRDQGTGIALADQRRIFDRFERAAGQRPSSGLGLGLWIVRQIATAMGGHIVVTSTAGQGAELTVTLPRTASP